MIPQLIHQTWKTANAPHQWRPFIETVQRLNPDWTYHLWTDEENEAFVRREFPAFLPVYMGFSRNIMRADVIRYLLMYRLGGVYLDLDYEVLQPFDFDDHAVVLPLNRSVAYGDARNELGNCFFASVPGHPFWCDVIDDLQQHPPDVAEYTQVVEATGPMLLTKVFERHTYHDVYTPERMIYHPPSPTSARDVARIKSNGISRGIHHPWGSWKERWSMAYWKQKLKRLAPFWRRVAWRKGCNGVGIW